MWAATSTGNGMSMPETLRMAMMNDSSGNNQFLACDKLK